MESLFHDVILILNDQFCHSDPIALVRDEKCCSITVTDYLVIDYSPYLSLPFLVRVGNRGQNFWKYFEITITSVWSAGGDTDQQH